MSTSKYGTAAISPHTPVSAGSFVTLTYTYTAGHPIDESGYVKLTFRQVGDFGRPQFNDPAQPNYASIETTGRCQVRPRWDPKGHTRPWGTALYLQITDGYLDRGQQIRICFGDRRGGSPGWQMQTFCEHSFEFKTFVDPIATYVFKELPHSPTLEIVPGKPVRAVCIVPSQVARGEPFAYHLKLEDQWGNPVGPPEQLAHPGFTGTGVKTVQVVDETGEYSAESNPIQVSESLRTYQHFWADFHGQSEETIGTNTIEDYFRFARDVGLLDITAHQGNDFQITDAFWETIQQTTRRFYDPGGLVTFPGYEWSGNTPLGGDRNVFFLSEGGKLARSSRDLLPGQASVYPDANTADDLFARLKRPGQPSAFAFAHVGGRYADLAMHDPEIELAVEVHSAWGTFEWLVEDALQKGYRIGICANSDDHKCRPGASYPGAADFGSYGGLTCVLTSSLDRESVYAALKARHFYATTGQRTLIDLSVDIDGQQVMMGDVTAVGSDVPLLRASISATSGVESVEIYNGLHRIDTLRQEDPGLSSNRIKLLWGGAEIRGRGRMTSWDGTLKLGGNQISGFTPINFWNPLQPVQRSSSQELSWTANTTGGVMGIDFTLQDANAGELQIRTRQGEVSIPVAEISPEPRVWDFGGIDKKIKLYRLPLDLPRTLSVELALQELHDGDNPIYLRVRQEDGHMAWTSPVYLTKQIS